MQGHTSFSPSSDCILLATDFHKEDRTDTTHYNNSFHLC